MRTRRLAGGTERVFFIDNLLVRIHCIIVMIRWTGLAPWEFQVSGVGGTLVPRRPIRRGAHAEAGCRYFFFFFYVTELSDTKVYAPGIRALLGTASHFCEVFVSGFGSRCYAGAAEAYEARYLRLIDVCITQL